MAALPAGWASAGVTATFTLSFDVEMRAQVAGVLFPWARIDTDHGLWIGTREQSGATDLGCVGLFVGTGLGVSSYSTVETILINQVGFGAPTYVTLNSGAGSCTPGWLPAVTCTKTIGPLRLGVTWQNDRWHYAWFRDAATVVTVAVAGVTYRTETFSDPPTITTYTYGIGPYLGSGDRTVTGQGELLQFSRVLFGRINPGDAGSSLYSHVRFSNFSANNGSGATAVTIAETTEYKATIDATVESGYQYRGGPFFSCPAVYRGDIAADDTSGASVAADATWEGARVCPANFVVTKPFVGVTGDQYPSNYSSTLLGHVVPTAVLADPWLSAQTVRPYDADLSFRFEGNAPRTPGAASPSDYSAGSITIAASLSVLQSANVWAITLGAGTVGGTATVPIFTITSAPASVERNLAESWRDWNTAASGDYQAADLYTATKRDSYASGASDDRWGWSLYAYLDLDLTVPAGDDTELAIAVTWAYPVTAGTPGTIDTIEVTYSGTLSFPAGARNTRRVDLMFPVENQSRPFYGERVDKIRLIGLKAGNTTVHAINLVTDEDAYITLSGRSETLPDSTIRYTGIVIAQDGAAPSLLFGQDQSIVPTSDSDADGFTDARGDHQNGRMIENGVTNVLLGKAPGMRSATIAAALAELNRIEGITASYSDTAIDAALTDADGNELGFDAFSNPSPVPRSADFFLPTLPADRITAGVAYDVRAQFVVSGVVIPCGLQASQMRIFQRNHLGQTLEGLATDADYNRHGSGVNVYARGYTGGAPGSGDTLLDGPEATDASGYVVLYVRTGTIGGVPFNAYLTNV